MDVRPCLTRLVIAKDLIAGMIDQGEPVDVENLQLSKAFDSMFHRLLVKKMIAMRMHLKTTRWVEEFLKDRTEKSISALFGKIIF